MSDDGVDALVEVADWMRRLAPLLVLLALAACDLGPSKADIESPEGRGYQDSVAKGLMHLPAIQLTPQDQYDAYVAKKKDSVQHAFELQQALVVDSAMQEYHGAVNP